MKPPTQTVWPKTKLVDIQAEEKWALNGGPFGSKLVSSMYLDEGVPVIRGVNLPQNARFLMEQFVFVSEGVAQELRANWARPGDIVFTQRGTLGQVGLISDNSPFERFIISQSQMKLTVNRECAHPEFVYYTFRHPETVQRINDLASSSGVPHINLETLRQFEISLPPVNVQRRIAGILSAYDDLIEVNERRIAILEEMSQRLFEEWFGNGQVHRGRNASLSGKTTPGWLQTTLGEVAENLDRLRKPLSKLQRQARPGPYPYYGAAKVFDYIDDFIFEGRYVLLAEDGSVVTPEGYPVLQLTSGRFWANNHTHVLRGLGRVSTEYLYLALKHQPISGLITGAAQPKITQANMNRIPIILGDEATHRQFDRQIRPLFALSDTLHLANANLSFQRDFLLPKLISGEVDVSEVERKAGRAIEKVAAQ